MAWLVPWLCHAISLHGIHLRIDPWIVKTHWSTLGLLSMITKFGCVTEEVGADCTEELEAMLGVGAGRSRLPSPLLPKGSVVGYNHCAGSHFHTGALSGDNWGVQTHTLGVRKNPCEDPLTLSWQSHHFKLFDCKEKHMFQTVSDSKFLTNIGSHEVKNKNWYCLEPMTSTHWYSVIEFYLEPH